jgi:hypothetical protein
LATVLRNLVRRKLREERRRARREQVVARPYVTPAAPPTADVEDMRVYLAKLVLRLPEHYREPLMLRYYEGLEPAEIADRTGVPASTVRTRIQRGLARIRTDLNGTSFSAAPLLHAIATGRVPRRLPLAPLAAAGVVLVAVVATFESSQPTSRTPSPEAHTQNRTASNYREVRPVPQPRTVNPARDSGEIVRAHSALTLTGRIVLPHGVVHEVARIEISAPGRAATVHATARNAFAVDLAPLYEAGRPANLQLRATHPECETVTRPLPADAREVTITMQRAPLVSPELLAPTLPETEALPVEPESIDEKQPGLPRAPKLHLHATVHLPDDIAPETVALAICRGERCLRFRIPPGRRVRLAVGALLTGAPAARLVVRASSRHTVATRRTISIWSGPRLDPLVLRLKRGRLTRGRVTWANNTPAAGVTVAALTENRPFIATTTDAAGRFVIALPEERAFSLLALARGAVPATAAATEDVRLLLRKGEKITGRVRGLAKVLSMRPRVELRANGTSDAFGTKHGTVGWTAAGPRWTALATRPDRNGAFRFAGLAPGIYTARCAGEEIDAIAPGHVEFAPRPVDMAIVATDGMAPIADARVTVGDSVVKTDANGTAAVTVFDQTNVKVRADAAGHQSTERESMAGTDRSVELTPTERLGRLQIALAANDTPLLAVARVTLQAAAGDRAPESRIAAVKSGVIRIDTLAAGNYKIKVDPGGWHFPAITAAAIIAGDVTRLDLRPKVGGRIRATLLDRFGDAAPADLLIEPAPLFQAIAQRDLADALTPTVPDAAQPYTSNELIAPGRYRLWFVPRNSDGRTRVTAVEVVGGERADVTLRP